MFYLGLRPLRLLRIFVVAMQTLFLWQIDSKFHKFWKDINYNLLVSLFFVFHRYSWVKIPLASILNWCSTTYLSWDIKTLSYGDLRRPSWPPSWIWDPLGEQKNWVPNFFQSLYLYWPKSVKKVLCWVVLLSCCESVCCYGAKAIFNNK